MQARPKTNDEIQFVVIFSAIYSELKKEVLIAKMKPSQIDPILVDYCIKRTNFCSMY